MVGAANVAALPRSADASSAASIGRTRWDALGRILSPNLVHVNSTVLQVCLFVIILHSPPKGGAQLSYHKPADH